MYVDDMFIQDLVSARDYFQRSVRATVRVDRDVFDPRKVKDMTHHQDFCGVEHDLPETFTTGSVRLRPRERLLTRIFFLLSSTLSQDLLLPALCSKIMGVSGDQHAVRQRLYTRLSHRLRSCLLHQKSFALMPKRDLTTRQVQHILSSPRLIHPLDVKKEQSV